MFCNKRAAMSLLFAIQSSGPLAKPFFKYQGATSFLHCHETELIKDDSNNDVRFKSAAFTVAHVLTKLSLT